MIIKNYIRPTRLKRFLFFVVGDFFLLTLSFAAAFFIRFEFSFPEPYFRVFAIWLPFLICIKILMLHIFRLYNLTWMFVGIKELVSIANANIFSSALLYLLNIVAMEYKGGLSLPRSIILIDFILSLLLIGNLRVGKRLYHEALRRQSQGKPTLIVGAGPTGERLAREFLRSDQNGYTPVAFVDDDPNKRGTSIHGVRVVGRTDDIAEIVASIPIKAAIIAITTAKHVFIKQLFDVLSDCGIKEIKVFPHLNQLPNKSLSMKDIHDIKIEDLLYREAVKTDFSSIRKFLQTKTVLVTGGAGSIGSEIVRQALRYHPAQVIVFDTDETEIYNLMLEVKPLARMTTQVIPYVGDIRKFNLLEKVFSTYHPQIIFHAAAYKHVPMMELFPHEALETNFLGTYHLASLALKYNVHRFVNISTDKAVNPSSVMGASKRLAEMVCTAFNQCNGTKFVSVRFGNVLGSRGSVVPVFLEQIRKGGPITVTHPDVERFFMTIPEAVSLVFQAAAMGVGGEVFVLDMGKAVRILKIAEDLIKLNGMEPYQDIKIDFVGLRPGEKLLEELLTAEEGTTSTEHEKIFIARNSTEFSLEELSRIASELGNFLSNGCSDVRIFIKKHVPFFPAAG